MKYKTKITSSPNLGIQRVLWYQLFILFNPNYKQTKKFKKLRICFKVVSTFWGLLDISTRHIRINFPISASQRHSITASQHQYKHQQLAEQPSAPVSETQTKQKRAHKLFCWKHGLCMESVLKLNILFLFLSFFFSFWSNLDRFVITRFKKHLPFDDR